MSENKVSGPENVWLKRGPLRVKTPNELEVEEPVSFFISYCLFTLLLNSKRGRKRDSRGAKVSFDSLVAG